jgi:hypothetical protein
MAIVGLMGTWWGQSALSGLVAIVGLMGTRWGQSALRGLYEPRHSRYYGCTNVFWPPPHIHSVLINQYYGYLSHDTTQSGKYLPSWQSNNVSRTKKQSTFRGAIRDVHFRISDRAISIVIETILVELRPCRQALPFQCITAITYYYCYHLPLALHCLNYWQCPSITCNQMQHNPKYAGVCHWERYWVLTAVFEDSVPLWKFMTSADSLTPELNPSAQRCLTIFFYWRFCFFNRAFR